MTSLQVFTLVALVAFGVACAIAFMRGARLPPSAFDEDPEDNGR